MKCFNMFFVCLAAISIMLLGSCSSDSNNNPTTPTTTDYGFTCTLNGGGYTNQAIKITPGSGSV